MAERIVRPKPRPARNTDTGSSQVAGTQKSNSDAVANATFNPHRENGFLDNVAKNVPPTLAGYEDARYQEHDAHIASMVERFNADKAGFIGATADQAAGIPDVDPALLKSWLIQETGGGDKRSRAAWAKDPAQVNVPGDWGAPKADAHMGLSKPKRRNEGDLDTNMDAALIWLARKGFSRSGKAPSELQGGQEFGGWRKALENYNGRGKKQRNGKSYKQNYAERILNRANAPDKHVPIQF